MKALQTTSPLCRLATLLLITAMASPSAHAGDEVKAGVELRAEATADDLGMPIYPGAVVLREKDGGSGQASLGLWGNALGFRLAIVKYGSRTARFEDVARFYREVLAKHGPVLECTAATTTPAPPPPAAASGAGSTTSSLSCDKQAPKPGEIVYKVGTDKNFRLVALQPMAQGVSFQLLRLQSKGL